MLVTFNFGLQLLIDLCSVWFVDKIGYRVSMVLALVWACVPVINGIVFLKVPIAPLLAALGLKQRMEIKEKRIIEG